MTGPELGPLAAAVTERSARVETIAEERRALVRIMEERDALRGQVAALVEALGRAKNAPAAEILEQFGLPAAPTCSGTVDEDHPRHPFGYRTAGKCGRAVGTPHRGGCRLSDGLNDLVRAHDCLEDE